MIAVKEKSKKRVTKQQNQTNQLCGLEWLKRKSWPSIKQNGTRSLSLIDLFSGCGGMTLGVWEALRLNGFNLDIKLAVDNNYDALKVYNHNFDLSDDEVYFGDINDLLNHNSSKGTNLSLDSYSGLDILVAGPPCQGHSNLNNHTRRNDPRNKLYLSAIKFIKIVLPKVAIIENVSSVIHDKENVIAKSKKLLEDSGYTVYSIMIDTSDYGLAQARKRHIQLAIHNVSIPNFSLDRYKSEKPLSLSESLNDILDEPFEKEGIFYTPSVTSQINQKRIEYLFSNNLFDLPDSLRPDCHKNKKHSYKSSYGRMLWDKPAQTITSGFGSIGQGRYIHPIRKRVITPHEAARIQGFPDFFDFGNVSLRTSLHTIIANAVPPRVIAMIINELLTKNVM